MQSKIIEHHHPLEIHIDIMALERIVLSPLLQDPSHDSVYEKKDVVAYLKVIYSPSISP